MKKLVCLVLCVVFPVLTSAQQTPTTSAPAAASAPAATPQAHTLLDGTPVKLRLGQTLSSADAKTGQDVPFEVVEELKVDDIVVLPKGATAIATVTDAQPKRRMGRGGKLDMSISYARLADGEKAALRGVKEAKGGGHVGAMTGAIVATSLIIWPAAPFFLFMHGKDISIPQGTEITAFVEGDMHLDMLKFGATSAPSATTQASAPGQASLTIDSIVPGADIEVDGAFVGSTPSTLTLTPGPHEITVRKKGYTVWTRKVTVTSGSIHVSAELEKEN